MPAAIPLAAAAVGAGASAIAGASGVGKNTYHASNFADTKNYDPNQFQYGGMAGKAERDADYYGSTGYEAQGRGAAQAGYGLAGTDWANGTYDRQGQQNIANVMMARAQGQTPSIAGMQANEQMRQLGQQSGQQMQQAQAAQASQAASARGAAGVALAGQTAANNTANAQGQIGSGAAMAAQGISNQAQVNAANERMQAEQSAAGQYNNMRSSDLASQNTNQQMQQFNAGLQQQQHGLNDQMQLGMTGYEQQVRQAQLNASMNQQNMLSNSNNTAQGLQMGVNQNNANNEMKFFGAGLGAVEGAAQMGQASSAGGATPKAEGGPIEPGKPYLVGERGPELIVPRQHGLVIPAEQTPQVLSLYEPPGQKLQMSDSGHAYLASDAVDDGRPSLVSRQAQAGGLMSPWDPGQKVQAATAPAQRKTRTMTPSEMRDEADRLEKEMRAYYEAQMAAGPAVQPQGLMGGRVSPY